MGRRKKVDVTGDWAIILVVGLIILKVISSYPWIIALVLSLGFILLIGFIVSKITDGGFKERTIQEIDRMDPFKFEEYIRDLYKHMGYYAMCTPKSGDFGADVLIQDGKYKAAIQVKKYSKKHNTGIEAVQQIIGACSYYNVDEGIVITTSYFTQAAIELANSAGVELIDRDDLKNMLYKSRKLLTN
nr:restriction endonuclease [uncultured Niameybacter sp.]